VPLSWVVAACVGIAGVLFLAAVAKLLDLGGTRTAASAMGVPRALAGPVSVTLPVVELAVASGLLVEPTPVPAVLAAGLFSVFSLVVAASLVRGRRPACNCFGALHTKPIGWSTLVRNLALAGLAAAVAIARIRRPGPDPIQAVGNRSVTEIVVGVLLGTLVVAVAIEGALLVALLRRHGRVLSRLDALEAGASAGAAVPRTGAPGPGLPVGAHAPEFRLDGIHGDTLTLAALRSRGRLVLLVFTDAACGPCHALLPEVAQWQRDYAGDLNVAVVASGDRSAIAAVAAEHELANVLTDRELLVAQQYAFTATPSAVLVTPDGTIAAPLATGADAIRALVHRASKTVPVAMSTKRSALPTIGDAAPSFRLPSTDHREVGLGDFVGREVLLVFWNPGCAFCEQMLPDLRAWEAARSPHTPELLILSTGETEANRAQGLRSPVLLDPKLEVMSAYGASGTPMAVKIDETGRVASAVVAGASAVMDLARSTPQFDSGDAVMRGQQ
jgi:peroxiredoxin